MINFLSQDNMPTRRIRYPIELNHSLRGQKLCLKAYRYWDIGNCQWLIVLDKSILFNISTC
jgi:hypothetical protein